MGIVSGALTVARFRVTGPRAEGWRQSYRERLDEHAFRDPPQGAGKEEVEGWVTRFLRRHFAVTERFHEQHFVVELNGRRFLTPLAVALVLVETTDLLFAVDSIPAIFAITADPFLVFTSNVFAILCLRSLYFGLAGLIQRFRYLKVSLALVLAIVGVKMLAGTWIKAWLGEESNYLLLAVIFAVLLGGGLASWLVDRRDAAAKSATG